MSNTEAEWAPENKGGQIPAGARFPRAGDIYEALEDISVCYRLVWAPPGGGGQGVLKKGEKVVVEPPTDPRPVGVNALAVDYSAVADRMLPASDRNDPKYGGYYFWFKTAELNEKFRLVHEGSAPKD
jgi:hypothetical protein